MSFGILSKNKTLPNILTSCEYIAETLYINFEKKWSQYLYSEREFCFYDICEDKKCGYYESVSESNNIPKIV